MTANNGVIDFNASFSERLLNLQMIQKPASFIHGTSFDPQPMANPIYTGLKPRSALNAIPDNIPDAMWCDSRFIHDYIWLFIFFMGE